MNELIHDLVTKIDEDTDQLVGGGSMIPLSLFGSRNSRYLKGVNAKARKFRIPVRWFDCPLPIHFHEGFFIVDKEELKIEDWDGPAAYDLDNVFHPGMSCTAMACAAILDAMGPVAGKNVCIIGRGHAVKGLADALVAADATVTICHSKTTSLLDATYNANVIINAAPNTHPLYDITKSVGSVVLDVSGSLDAWNGSGLLTYVGPQEIGRLNTALALNRFALR